MSEDTDIHAELRKLWQAISESGVNMTSIQFEVVDGKLECLKINGKLKGLKNEVV